MNLEKKRKSCRLCVLEGNLELPKVVFATNHFNDSILLLLLLVLFDLGSEPDVDIVNFVHLDLVYLSAYHNL